MIQVLSILDPKKRIKHIIAQLSMIQIRIEYEHKKI